MSRQAMWNMVRMAWSMLAGPPDRDVRPGRPRESRPLPEPDELPIAAEGFAEEALPWLDAVYSFAIRLTRGDRDAADDLVQETFLRAHRFWHTFQRGTNAKSWLFTICRNTYLHEKQLVRSQRERPAADLDARVEALAAATAFEESPPDPEREFFSRLIDDRVIEAIDELPVEFHEVLVLSDLGDLKYGEVAQVLDIPVGTAKSRLFRARRLLQDRLREFAIESGYVQEVNEW
jgi:RNA polymerase sigma-70 factor (ECF subfamily)